MQALKYITGARSPHTHRVVQKTTAVYWHGLGLYVSWKLSRSRNGPVLNFHVGVMGLSKILCDIVVVLHINSSLQCSPWSQKGMKPYQWEDPENLEKTKYRVGQDDSFHAIAHETKAHERLITLQTGQTLPPVSTQRQHQSFAVPTTNQLVAIDF